MYIYQPSYYSTTYPTIWKADCLCGVKDHVAWKRKEKKEKKRKKLM